MTIKSVLLWALLVHSLLACSQAPDDTPVVGLSSPGEECRREVKRFHESAWYAACAEQAQAKRKRLAECLDAVPAVEREKRSVVCEESVGKIDRSEKCLLEARFAEPILNEHERLLLRCDALVDSKP